MYLEYDSLLCDGSHFGFEHFDFSCKSPTQGSLRHQVSMETATHQERGMEGWRGRGRGGGGGGGGGEGEGDGGGEGERERGREGGRGSGMQCTS